jgi:hypothetical protein
VQVLTIAFSANFLISLIARGALFLKETPWTYYRRIESVFRPKCLSFQNDHNVDFIKLIYQVYRSLTLLCRWIVYSRATTSAMAERPLPAGLVVEDLVLGAIVAAEC